MCISLGKSNIFLVLLLKVWLVFLKCTFLKMSFIMNAPLVSYPFPVITFHVWIISFLLTLGKSNRNILLGYRLIQNNMQVRVANVVADHDDLSTQWRPIKMSKFRANIFLIRTTSNYVWASEVFKNQRFKSHLFSFFQYKKYPKLKTWVNFAPIFFWYELLPTTSGPQKFPKIRFLKVNFFRLPMHLTKE